MAETPRKWLRPLNKLQIDELLCIAAKVEKDGLPLNEIQAGLYPLPTLEKDIAEWRRTLQSGAGMVLVRGVPVIDDGTYRNGIKQMGRPVQPVFTAFYDDGVVWPGGEREHVDAVIFATGFRPNLDFLSGLSPNANLDPTEHHKGISTRFPRLAFCGRSGQNGFASATLRGVGRDAELVVRHVLQKG